jgi:hypothetical protein
MSDDASTPGPTVRVHLQPSSSPEAPSSGSQAGRNNNDSNAVEMVPVHVQAAGTSNGLASGSGPDGIHASMDARGSPSEHASPDAGLFNGNDTFPLSVANLQRLFNTETNDAEVQRIIGDEVRQKK